MLPRRGQPSILLPSSQALPHDHYDFPSGEPGGGSNSNFGAHESRHGLGVTPKSSRSRQHSRCAAHRDVHWLDVGSGLVPSWSACVLMNSGRSCRQYGWTANQCYRYYRTYSRDRRLFKIFVCSYQRYTPPVR